MRGIVKLFPRQGAEADPHSENGQAGRAVGKRENSLRGEAVLALGEVGKPVTG
jgi:hypothetical protein